MAEHLGTGEFSGKRESCIEQMENFIVAHITHANKKQATLMSDCEATTYKIIHSLVAPKKLKVNYPCQSRRLKNIS